MKSINHYFIWLRAYQPECSVHKVIAINPYPIILSGRICHGDCAYPAVSHGDRKLVSVKSLVFSMIHLKVLTNPGESNYASSLVDLCHKTAFLCDPAPTLRKHWKECLHASEVFCPSGGQYVNHCEIGSATQQYQQSSQKLSKARTAQMVWQRNQCLTCSITSHLSSSL